MQHRTLAGPQPWKAKSIALTKQDAEQKQRDLQEAVHAAQQLVRFITLADSLMLSQLAELARLAVLLVVRQLETPRKTGLYIVSGAVDDMRGQAGSASGAAPGAAGVPWGRSNTFASVALAVTLNAKRRTLSSGSGLRAGQLAAGGDGERALSPRGLWEVAGGGLEDWGDGPGPGQQGLSFMFSPGGEELTHAVTNLPREIVHVVALSSSALGSYPEVRQLLNEIAHKGVAVSAATAAGVAAAAGVGARRHDALPSGAARMAGGYNGEIVRTALDVRAMMVRARQDKQASPGSMLHTVALTSCTGTENLCCCPPDNTCAGACHRTARLPFRVLCCG